MHVPGGRDILVRAGSLGLPRGSVSAMEAADIVVLTPKNVQALRTLFNVAHRLHHLLGGAWTLVLDNLNTLDRILDAPSTTTQVTRILVTCRSPTWPHSKMQRPCTAVSPHVPGFLCQEGRNNGQGCRRCMPLQQSSAGGPWVSR